MQCSIRLWSTQGLFDWRISKEWIVRLPADTGHLCHSHHTNGDSRSRWGEYSSPSLIRALQEILETHNSKESCEALKPTAALWKTDRLDLIDRLGYTVSFLQLFRRHHIFEMVKNCRGATTPAGGIIITTSCDFASSSRRPGNPANIRIAETTTKMMQETFSAITPGTNEYEPKYRLMSHIRRIGRRLNILERRFGSGILGLMIDGGSTDPTAGITDAMLVKNKQTASLSWLNVRIMSPADAEYDKFVDILDESQGTLLWAFSSSVLPVVQALTEGSAHQ
jgi:hypothetical protein